MQIVFDSQNESISNPSPVEATREDGRRAVLLHFVTMNNPTVERHGRAMQMWSTDDGLTWHSSSIIEYPPLPNRGGLIGPSTGLQSSGGTLYFSALQPAGSTADMHHRQFLYLSLDHGATWRAAGSLANVSECSLAFQYSAADGRILTSCRASGRHGRYARRRALAEWSAEGVPGPLSYPPELLDANCQGSLINALAEGGRRVLYQSNALEVAKFIPLELARRRMVVRRSDDGGATWSAPVDIWRGPAAYSQLVELPSHVAPAGPSELGILFEAGWYAWPYASIVFVRINTTRVASMVSMHAPTAPYTRGGGHPDDFRATRSVDVRASGRE
jgi:hypothetical protein